MQSRDENARTVAIVAPKNEALEARKKATLTFDGPLGVRQQTTLLIASSLCLTA